MARVIPVNGSKHMTLTSYSVEGAASVAREYAGAGQVRYVVPHAGDRNVEALLLADACIAEIRTFMQKQGLIQLAPASKSRRSGRPG